MRNAALIALGSLAACGPDIPEIGKDLPSNYREGQRIFDGRVKRRFPVGLPEARLVRALKAQGFTRLPGYDGVEDATFTKAEFPFKTIWSIRWRSSNGRVEEIWGIYGVSAP